MSVLGLLFQVLFIGHSLVGPNLPDLVEAALDQLSGPTVVEAQVINGASLAYNWDHAQGAEGVDSRARLARGGVDVLVLTEAQPVAVQTGSAEQVERFATLAQQSNPDVRVFLYETWPSLASGPGMVIPGDPGAATPWATRVADELPLWEAIAAKASAKGVSVTLIPAGQAMLALSQAMAAGKVPGLTNLRQVFTDDTHPDGKGLYFLAMVQAAAISGKSPEGLPARLTRNWLSRDAVITDAQARAFQAVAWEAVSSYQPKVTTAAAPPAKLTGITNPNLALGLAGVNDWTVQQPFLDIMKTARPWVGHLPGQWGGWSHDDLAAKGYLDANGWPKALPSEVTGITTLILTDLPDTAGGVAGRYVLTWQGDGTLKVDGRARIASATPGRILFDYSPGEGAVLLTITATEPANPIRNIRVVREDREGLLAAGQIFNPDWLARIRGAKMVRFMDWGLTNDSVVTTPATRAHVGDYTWARVGVPPEIMVALANEIGADAWFNIPHMADDALVSEWANIAQKGLKPGLRAWVEYSNEVWNWQFAQAKWAEEQGKARWGQDQAWVQFYVLRAGQVADIWAGVFKADPARLVRVVSVQTGWLGLEDQILNAPLVIAEGGKPPASHFDAYAVTGYFSAMLGADGKVATVRDWLAQSRAADPAHPYAMANTLAAQELRDGSVTGDPTDTLQTLLHETLPYHAGVAKKAGLRLVMYEGGTHVVGFGGQVDDAELTAFFTQLNYSPEMAILYGDLLSGWAKLTDAPFNAFVDVLKADKWGSWGALRHLTDDNPRWQAIAGGCGKC
ncbi:hypothetical protein [Fuscibacter oryzae]|uniref:Uncharacterized protein n=1 Tax=Fuscibacter oryzae TaxID=2803939 RepID=A0A8J7MU54_9RHOB|nr:hypothetical protein [Fuscibacter oryzae]MBL4929636.1 hypothetical protein [Fuscibacter oryzae]